MMEQQSMGFDPNALVQRVRRLATMDMTVFDEIRVDASSTVAAVIVAAVSFFVFGLGGWLWWVFQDGSYKDSTLLLYSVLLGTVVSMVLWAVAIGVTHTVLTQVFRARADINELVRVMGFATAPLVVGLLVFIPGLDMGIGVLAIGLLFGASFIAVQSATDAPAGKALVAVAVGFAVWALIESALVQGDSWKTISQNIFLFAPR